MALILFDESRLKFEDAPVIVLAMTSYGHVAWSDRTRKSISLAEFADRIERVYDCTSAGDPVNAEVVKVLRRNDSASLPPL